MTLITKENLHLIDPKIAGGNYSVDIHRVAKRLVKKCAALGPLRVFRDRDNLVFGAMDSDGWVYGCRLWSKQTYAYGHLKNAEVVDFWDRYLAEGMCYTDPRHVRIRRPRDPKNGEIVKCPHCDFEQVARRKRRVVVDVVWDLVEATP